MSLRETENREEGRCKFCGGKLSLVKRMRKEEFCSPEHRDDFLLLNGDMAMERLTQSTDRKEPWTPKPREEAAAAAPPKGEAPKSRSAEPAPQKKSAAKPSAAPAAKGSKGVPAPAAQDAALARLMESPRPPASKPSLLDAARAASAPSVPSTPPADHISPAPAPEEEIEIVTPAGEAPMAEAAPPPDPPAAGLAAQPVPRPAASAGDQTRKHAEPAQPELPEAPPAPPPAASGIEDEEIEIIVETRKTVNRPPGTFVLDGWFATGPRSPLRDADFWAGETNGLGKLAFPALAPDTADFAGLKMNGKMAGLVDQAKAISGDLMTILVVRAAPVVFHVRPAKPAGPAPEPEDWDAFAAFAEAREREEQGPDEAGFVPYTGVPARDMVTAPVSALFGGDRVWPDWRSFVKRPRVELARRPAEEEVEPPLARPTTVLLVSTAVESARRRILHALHTSDSDGLAGYQPEARQTAPPTPLPMSANPVSFEATLAARPRGGERMADSGSAAEPAQARPAGRSSAPDFKGQPPQAGVIPTARAVTGETGLAKSAARPAMAAGKGSGAFRPAMSGTSSGFGFARRAGIPETQGSEPGAHSALPSAARTDGVSIGTGGSGPIVALALRRQPPTAAQVELPVEAIEPRMVLFRVVPRELHPSARTAEFGASPALNGSRPLTDHISGRQPDRARHVAPLVFAVDRAAAPAPAPAIAWEALEGPRPQSSERPQAPPLAVLALQRLVELQAMLCDSTPTLPPRDGGEFGYEASPQSVSMGGATALRPRRAAVPVTSISLRTPGEDRFAEPRLTPHPVEFAATADQWGVLA